MLRYLIPLWLAATPLLAQAPAGAPAATPAATRVADEGTQRPVRQSWTSPRRSFAVGDLVTVLVDEYTLASANTGNTAVDNRRRELGLDGGFDMATSGMSARANVRTSNNAQSTQRGEAVRQNRFQSEMSVRIVEVDPATGLLRLEGTKLVDVDRNRQEVTFTGFARPQDISAQNMVESWRVADAKLEYSAKGSLGKPKGSILGRVLGMVWP
ncbi:MAG TPA: flagellar basal body L-ring protein FlgH [Gemmatimonadales bacterium]